MNIGQRIKSRRLKLNMTVDEVAEKIGKNRATVYRYESSEIEDLPTSVLEPLAKALQTTPGYLMGWEDEEPPKEPKEVFAKNLTRLLAQNGKSQADLVLYMNTTASTISDWCNGKKYPRVDKMQKLADYFGVLKSDLTEEHPPELTPVEYNPTHKIPVLGRISAGLPLYAEEHIEEYIYTELNGGNDYFGLRVVGDSMNAARICEGDIIIVRQQEQVEDGEIAVVMVGNEDATVKRFHKEGRNVFLSPQSYNPAHKVQVYDMKETNIRIIGKVVQVVFKME